ncbi:hypothetical protein KCU88_g166, partial [Aureobasidium melanogenum]
MLLPLVDPTADKPCVTVFDVCICEDSWSCMWLGNLPDKTWPPKTRTPILLLHSTPSPSNSTPIMAWS